jgi:hypothetical protein
MTANLQILFRVFPLGLEFAIGVKGELQIASGKMRGGIMIRETFSRPVTNDIQNMPPLRGLRLSLVGIFYKYVAPTALACGV